MSPYRILAEVLGVLALLGGIFALGHHGGVTAEHNRMQVKLDMLQHQFDDEHLKLQAAVAEQRSRNDTTARAAATSYETKAASIDTRLPEISHATQQDLAVPVPCPAASAPPLELRDVVLPADVLRRLRDAGAPAASDQAR